MTTRRTGLLVLQLLCCCVVVGIARISPAGTLGAGAGAPAAPAAAKPAVVQLPDPLGRSTPHGTVMGFLRAVDHADYKAAASYLEGKQSARDKEKHARDLAVVLNRGSKIRVDDLSRTPEGRLDDDYVSPYLEKVGTATYGQHSLDIVLRRTTQADTPPLWLFSYETLHGVAAAAEHLELPWAEAIWPESFREVRFVAFPLFRIINQLVIATVLIAVAWLLTLLTLATLRLLRPVAVRCGVEYGERALARIKWVRWLLFFSVLGRLAAEQSVTAAGRMFYDYLAGVLIIVAVSWLLVRLTRLATGARIERLRHGTSRGRIAGVELFGWLLVCVWVVAGLFVILHSSGVELTAAIAGLGVGGIAIAFAAQKTLENLFGTVMVISDEVVKVGDYCQAGTIEGRIESIGLRSTRIRTLDRAVVTIPNGQLAAMSVGNTALREKFLFRHTIRLRYDTAAAQLRDVLAKITGILSEHSTLESASVRVRLIRFGDASLELEAFAYVLTPEGDIFLQIQEELLLRIMDVIEASGTAVALPVRPAPVCSDFVVAAPTPVMSVTAAARRADRI